MKIYDFDEVVKREGSGCVKWELPFATNAKTRYPLWVADMDFACSEAIQKALHKRVEQRVYGYNLGYDSSYIKAVCSWFLRRFDWKIDPHTIVYSPGIVSAIAYLIELLSNEGDGILIQTPIYHPFRKKIEACKRCVVENPLVNTNGYYTMDFKHLEDMMKREDVKGMILCSPHNPGGRVWKKEELLRVVDIAKRYKKWIIADEIHCDIVRQGIHHIPLLTIASAYQEYIVSCTAPSKSFNLAGLQISNIIIPNETTRALWKSFVEERLAIDGPNSFAITAVKAAYNESEEWLNQVNLYIDENMRLATTFLTSALQRIMVSPLEGTYMLWVDVRAYCTDEDILKKRLLEEGIIVNHGSMFGEAGTCFVRINVACTRQLMMDCLTLFVKCIQTL